MSSLLDTSVLVDVLRGDRAAVHFVSTLDDVPACSELSRVEVLRGLRSAERRPAERLFGAIRWIPVDEPIGRLAGELGRKWRRSHALGTVDLVIAATAAQLDWPLATGNLRHYPMFARLRAPY